MQRFACMVSFVLAILTGCDSGDNEKNDNLVCGSGDSPYYGCWVASCQLNDFQPNGPNWQLIRLNFTSNNKIIQNIKSYSNSSCTGTPDYDSDYDAGFTFEEMDSEMLPSGLTGYRLRMFGSDDSQLLTTVTPSNQLCVSYNFYFLSGSYRIRHSSAETDLNYDNCFDSY